jgi:multiple sugar transport system substrate-binding protein
MLTAGGLAVASATSSRTTGSVGVRPSTSVSKSSDSLCGSLTVWTDATRLAAVEDYAKTHPCVHLTTTTFAYPAGAFQTKIGLFNKEGSGWPDLAFDPVISDAGWLDSSQYNYAAPLNSGLVPQSQLNQWAANSLAVCSYGGKIYCLRNDIGADVLWYNAPLMKKFGYTVPTTWSEWAKIGSEVATQHPGYIIGQLGDTAGEDLWFWPSGCPSNELLGTMKVLIDTTAPACTRVASLLDPLIKDGSVTILSIFSSDFAQKYGDNNHVLMSVGPTWTAGFVFQPDFKPAPHTWGAAPLMQWPNLPYTGNEGGGMWNVSSHASPAVQKLAASMAYWMTSSPVYQATAPTYPANNLAAKAWLSHVLSAGLYANSNVGAVFAKASADIWPGYSALLFDTDDEWADTVVPGLVAGKSLQSLLAPWGTALTNQAKSFGYTVVK